MTDIHQNKIKLDKKHVNKQMVKGLQVLRKVYIYIYIYIFIYICICICNIYIYIKYHMPSHAEILSGKWRKTH